MIAAKLSYDYVCVYNVNGVNAHLCRSLVRPKNHASGVAVFLNDVIIDHEQFAITIMDDLRLLATSRVRRISVCWFRRM